MKPVRVTLGWEHQDEDLEIVCEVTAGSAGQTYGPPEKCYPAEPPEVDVIEVVDFDGLTRPDLLAAAQADDRVYSRAVEAAEDKVLAMMEDAS